MTFEFNRYRTFVEWIVATPITARWFWRLSVDAGTEHLQLGFVISRPVPASRRWRFKVGLLFGHVCLELYLPDEDRSDDLEPEWDAEIHEDAA